MFLRNHSIKSRERHVIKGSWAAPSVNRFLLTLSETNGHVSHAKRPNWPRKHIKLQKSNIIVIIGIKVRD